MDKTYELSREEAIEIFEDKIVPYLFGKVTPVNNPKFILIGGQPGSGKTELAIYSKNVLKNNIITVDGDLLRPFHPEYMELFEKYGADASKYTHPDCARWSIWSVRRAREIGYNIILENTLRDKNVTETIERFYQRGYEIITKIMVVTELESGIGVFQRYIDVILANNPDVLPRYTAKERHDLTCKNIPDVIQAIHEQGYSKIEFFRRGIEDIERIAMPKTGSLKDFYLECKDYPYTKEDLEYLRSEILRVDDFLQKNIASVGCLNDLATLKQVVQRTLS